MGQGGGEGEKREKEEGRQPSGELEFHSSCFCGAVARINAQLKVLRSPIEADFY